MTKASAIRALGAAGLVALAMTACSSDDGAFRPRPISAASAVAGNHPLEFRLAEARAQLALGNVALALEIYRKALREAPDSSAALGGIAHCYDRMGRFDLSRRYHELALASAPDDERLYEALATSLDLQGRSQEAATIRREAGQRLAPRQAEIDVQPGESSLQDQQAEAALPMPVAAAVPPAGQPASASQAHDGPAVAIAAPSPQASSTEHAADVAARSVTVALGSPRPAAPAVSRPASADRRAGPRLERLSLGEVALVTTARPIWQPRFVERSRLRTTISFGAPIRRPLVPGARSTAAAPTVVLLNGARSSGLAARTRARLAASGWRRLAIGDSLRTSDVSMIRYPAAQQALASRLAVQFRFPLRHERSASGPITVILGRDAARAHLLERLRG